MTIEGAAVSISAGILGYMFAGFLSRRFQPNVCAWLLGSVASFVLSLFLLKHLTYDGLSGAGSFLYLICSVWFIISCGLISILGCGFILALMTRKGRS